MDKKFYSLAIAATMFFGASAMAQMPQMPPQGQMPQGERPMPKQLSAEERAAELNAQMGERLKLDDKQLKSVEKINLAFARSVVANTPSFGGRSGAMGGAPSGMRGGGGPGMGGGMGPGMGDMGGGPGMDGPGGGFGNMPVQKSPAEMQEALARAAETRAKKLEKVLTPEQFKVWNEMEQERVKQEQERAARRPEGFPEGGFPEGGFPGGFPQNGEHPTPPQRQQ